MDITMCSGQGCPIKEKCYRFTAKPSEFRQSYFLDTPIKIKDGVAKCDHYWGESQEQIWDSLKNIVNGKSN